MAYNSKGKSFNNTESPLGLLEEYNIYVQPINYPTVPVGTERLRFAPTPFHTDGLISDCVDAVRKVINE